MRGTLHLLPLGHSLSEDEKDGICVPIERYKSDVTDVRCIASLISATRIDTIDEMDPFVVDESLFAKLPNIAQRLIHTGCFNDRDNSIISVETEDLDSQQSSPERSLGQSLADMIEAKAIDSLDKVAERPQCNVVTNLVTPEMQEGFWMEKCTNTLTNVLQEVEGKITRVDHTDDSDRDLFGIDRTKVLYPIFKEMEKRSLLRKLDMDLMSGLLYVFNRQVGSVLHTDTQVNPDPSATSVESKQTQGQDRLVSHLSCNVDCGIFILMIMSCMKDEPRILAEEYIDNCIHLLCHTVRHILLSVFSHKSDARHVSTDSNSRQIGRHMAATDKCGDWCKKSLSRVIPDIYDFMDQISVLAQNIRLSDAWILQITATMMTLFGLEHCSTTVQLQQSSINVLRAVFVHYPAHRCLLLDESIDVMLKVPTQRRVLRTWRFPYSNQSIQMVSALIVTLIQSGAGLIDDGTFQARRNTSATGMDVLGDTRNHVAKLAAQVLDHSKYFVKGCISKCLRKTDERDHRAALENLIDDLLVMFVRPEWTGAELLLELFSSSLAGILHIQQTKDAKKLESQYTLSSLHLVGKMCTSIKSLEKNVARDNIELDPDVQAMSSEIKALFFDEPRNQDASISADAIASQVLEVLVLHFLRQNGQSNFMCHDSQQLLSIKLMSTSRRKGKDSSSESRIWYLLNGDGSGESMHLKSTSISNELGNRICMHASLKRDFCQSFHKLLSHVMALLTRNVSTFRSRVMKTLASMIDIDPMLMANGNVRAAVYNCFVDGSISVRQAAVDLAGHYVTIHPYLFEQYFDILTERLRDKGISVRKSVCKIFRHFLALVPVYDASGDKESVDKQFFVQKTRCMRVMIDRIGDPLEEPSIKDFISDTLQDIWFGSAENWDFQSSAGNGTDWKEVLTPDTLGTAQQNQKNLDENVEASIQNSTECITPSSIIQLNHEKIYAAIDLPAMIVEVVHGTRNQEWFATLLKRLLRKEYVDDTHKKRHAESHRLILIKSEQIVRKLVEYLVELEEGKLVKHCSRRDITDQFLSCMRALAAFCEANSSLLACHVETIMVYLHGDEVLKKIESKVQILTLDIINLVLSSMERIPEHLSTSLHLNLNTLIFQGPPSVVDVAVKCFTTLGRSSSQSLSILSKLLVTFTSFLNKHQDIQSLLNLPASARSSLQRALFSAGQIGAGIYSMQHKASNMCTGDHAVDEHALQTLYQIYCKYLRKTGNDACVAKAVQGISSLFKCQPALLLQAQQDEVLSELLGKASDEVKLQILMSLKDVLDHEERKMVDKQHSSHNEQQEASSRVDGDQECEASLVGSVMQAQLPKVLLSAKSHNPKIRTEAIACVSTLLTQGLVSPLHCVPTLIAVQCDTTGNIRDSAYAQILSIHERFPSLITTCFIQGLFDSYVLCHRLPEKDLEADRNAHGYCAFSRLYIDCIHGSRSRRNIFISSLLSQFFELSPESSRKGISEPAIIQCIGYYKYVASILASLPYKMEDEPLFIIHSVNRHVSLKSSSCLEDAMKLLARYHIHVPCPVECDDSEIMRRNMDTFDLEDDAVLTQLENKCCLVIALSLLINLKNHLKASYHLENEKCQLYQPTNPGKSLEESVKCRHKGVQKLLSYPSDVIKAAHPLIRCFKLIRYAETAIRTDEREVDFVIDQPTGEKPRRKRLRR